MIAILTRLLAAAIVLAITASTAFATITIKPLAIVEQGQVTLGDILDGLIDKAEAVVAPAPAPGRRVLIAVAQVAQVARANGIPWRGMPAFTHVVIERRGRIVPREAIEDALAKALEQEGMRGPIEVVLRVGTGDIHVANDQVPTVGIRDVDLNPATGQFAATVFAPAADRNAPSVRAIGQAFALANIPVLARHVATNEAITKRDIEWVPVRAARVKHSFATAQDQVVGMAPKRPIAIGEPIRLSDLDAPVLVAKGAVVTMEMKHGGMQLAAAGQALEAGGQGDTIRVANAKSKRVVYGTIIGANRVVVAINQRVVTATEN